MHQSGRGKRPIPHQEAQLDVAVECSLGQVGRGHKDGFLVVTPCLTFAHLGVIDVQL